MVAELDGIGMTSRRTRMRLIQRLRESGIVDEQVLPCSFRKITDRL